MNLRLFRILVSSLWSIGIRAVPILLVVGSLSGCFLDPSIRMERERREALDTYTKALDLEHRGEYSRALDLFVEAIEQSPRAAFYYHAGLCHERLGHDDSALIYLEKALEIEPEYALARAERDLVMQRLNLVNTAASPTGSSDGNDADSKVATSEDSSSTATVAAPSPELNEAIDAKETGALNPEAIRKLIFPELYGEPAPVSATAVKPGEDETLPEFHFPPTSEDQARLASQAGRLEQASYYLEKEVKANPESWELRIQLAQVLARSGRLSRAEAELRQAAELAPDRAETWYAWGSFYVRQENWVEADRCYRECLRIDPSHPKALNNQGVILMRLGLYEQAREKFQSLVALHPDFASAYLNLGILEAEHFDNPDQAITYAEDYLRLGGARSNEVRRWRQNLLLKHGGLPIPD